MGTQQEQVASAQRCSHGRRLVQQGLPGEVLVHQKGGLSREAVVNGQHLGARPGLHARPAVQRRLEQPGAGERRHSGAAQGDRLPDRVEHVIAAVGHGEFVPVAAACGQAAAQVGDPDRCEIELVQVRLGRIHHQVGACAGPDVQAAVRHEPPDAVGALGAECARHGDRVPPGHGEQVQAVEAAVGNGRLVQGVNGVKPHAVKQVHEPQPRVGGPRTGVHADGGVYRPLRFHSIPAGPRWRFRGPRWSVRALYPRWPFPAALPGQFPGP